MIHILYVIYNYNLLNSFEKYVSHITIVFKIMINPITFTIFTIVNKMDTINRINYTNREKPLLIICYL